MPIRPRELGPGPCELRLHTNNETILYGYVWVEQESSAQFDGYYVLMTSHGMPVDLPDVGDTFTFKRIAELDGEPVEGPDQLAALVAQTYPNATLSFQKIVETYGEWSP